LNRRDFIVTTGIAVTGSVLSSPLLGFAGIDKPRYFPSGTEKIIAEMNLLGCPKGTVLQWSAKSEELADQAVIRNRHFSGFETPLAPGGERVFPSGLDVVTENGRPVLEFTINGRQRGAYEGPRALVAGPADGRNYRVFAEIRPLCTGARPNFDRADVTEAMAGVIFRMHSLRHYYFFGIEGKRQLVLYRRWDDEWLALASKEMNIPDKFLTLEVDLDGDGIHCSCPDLGVSFLGTDTLFPQGKAGIRSLGRSQVASLRISQKDFQARRDQIRRKTAMEQEKQRSESVPDPHLSRVVDLKKTGGAPRFADFAEPGRFDMLVAGKRLRALTVEGNLLWEVPETITGLVLSREPGQYGRLIYGLTGRRGVNQQQDEIIILQGGDGKIIARCPVPDLDQSVSQVLFTLTSGNLSGKGPFDIVLREWKKNGGWGEKLWAYDQTLGLLWHQDLGKPAPKAPYGHANAIHFHDVTGDGKDEVLAGGTLFSPEGKIIWVHDRNQEMAEIYQAHHYDAVAIGNFAGDPDLDPTVFLTASSAGVYVVDGRTGITRAVHRVGHAQGHVVGDMRGDFPGQEVLVGCRWHNYGIATLFSGYGDRLWSLQTNSFSGEGYPVRWGSKRLILMDDMLYDGEGFRIKDLAGLRRMGGNISVINGIGKDPSDVLCVNADNKLYLFSPGPPHINGS
jgi:hypothetical protein